MQPFAPRKFGERNAEVVSKHPERVEQVRPVGQQPTPPSSYDEPGNPVIAIEEAVVGRLLAERPAGQALDAACGTGRHAHRLVELGHTVSGFDLTPEMLADTVALPDDAPPGTLNFASPFLLVFLLIPSK